MLSCATAVWQKRGGRAASCILSVISFSGSRNESTRLSFRWFKDCHVESACQTVQNGFRHIWPNYILRNGKNRIPWSQIVNTPVPRINKRYVSQVIACFTYTNHMLMEDTETDDKLVWGVAWRAAYLLH